MERRRQCSFSVLSPGSDSRPCWLGMSGHLHLVAERSNNRRRDPSNPVRAALRLGFRISQPKTEALMCICGPVAAIQPWLCCTKHVAEVAKVAARSAATDSKKVKSHNPIASNTITCRCLRWRVR